VSGFILTTHDDHNPLLQALRAEDVDVRSTNWQTLTHNNLEGCQAFYGNLFDEIKHWPLFIAKRRLLRQAGIPYVFWNRDAPWNVGIKGRNYWFLKQLKPVDIYLAHSLQESEDFGGASFDFPNAAQPAYYESTRLDALNHESAYQYDVSFYGSAALGKDRNSRERATFLAALQDRLRAANPGIRFKLINTADQPMSIADQLAFIRTSKINLNLGAMCDLPGKPSWGLPERVFGIPAAGGFLMTEYRKNLDSLFPEDAYSQFHNLDEAVTNIVKILADFGTMRYQANVLYQTVLNQHTYKCRAHTFCRILEARNK
jgi:spore maturation protein CgeB